MGDNIDAFHAKARRRRRLIYAVAMIITVGVASFAIWLSATTEKSTTYTRSRDLDPVHRTIVVGAVVAVAVGGLVYRLRKDRD